MLVDDADGGRRKRGREFCCLCVCWREVQVTAAILRFPGARPSPFGSQFPHKGNADHDKILFLPSPRNIFLEKMPFTYVIGNQYPFCCILLMCAHRTHGRRRKIRKDSPRMGPTRIPRSFSLMEISHTPCVMAKTSKFIFAQHMRTLAGPGSKIHFTSLSQSSCNALSSIFSSSSGNPGDASSSLASATAHQIGVLELMKTANVPLERVCLLDPKAAKELDPQDGEGVFDYFLFGVCHYCSLPLGNIHMVAPFTTPVRVTEIFIFLV